MLKLTVTYSYLLLPFLFLLLKGKFKVRIQILLAIYGILFFLLLFFYEWLPKGDARRYFQAIYTLVEYSFFAYFFWYNIRKKKFKSFIILVSGLFFLFQIFYVTTSSFKRLDSISVGIEAIFIFMYVFYFFYEFSKTANDSFIYNHYCFWISIGILIYLGGSFFFYILINKLDTNEVDTFGKMTYIAEIIKNILFSIALFFSVKFPTNNIQNKPQKIPNLDMY